MCIIYYFSHQPTTESSELSMGITKIIEITVEKVAPNADFITENIRHNVRR
ncbi:VanZ family protein [Psychrobacillus sp. L3]|uniref:VanZ family protein n=1 Tax=Psychrobacillus sp. L3 TaxID=3236891 RepID=UPI0036F4183D